jgi:hypothetical protein
VTLPSTKFCYRRRLPRERHTRNPRYFQNNPRRRRNGGRIASGQRSMRSLPCDTGNRRQSDELVRITKPQSFVRISAAAAPPVAGRLPFRRSTSRQGRTPFANGPLAFHPVATRGLDRRGRCRPGHHLGSRCPAPVTPVAQGLARETAFERVSLTSSAFPAAAPHAGYTEVSRSSELIFRRLSTVEALSGRAALIMMACAWSGPACGEIARRTILL